MQKNQNTNSSSDEVYRGVVEHNCSIDFSSDAKHLSVVENSAFADILGCIVTDTSAWYRHIVKYMYSDL